MAKSIPQLPDLGRAPNTGDLMVIQGANGGTYRIDFDRLKAILSLKKHIVTLAPQQTTIENIPNFGLSGGLFSAVVYGSEPLDETGEMVVPQGHYRPDYAGKSIFLGYEAVGGEKVLIIYL